MKAFFSKIWAGWKKFARVFGAVQAEIILFLFYFLIFTPTGLIFRIFRFDPLRIREIKGSNWQSIKSGAFDRRKATHQS
jgi:hypothetical protein